MNICIDIIGQDVQQGADELDGGVRHEVAQA